MMIRYIRNRLSYQRGELTYCYIRAILHQSNFQAKHRGTIGRCSSSDSYDPLIAVPKRNLCSCYTPNRGFHNSLTLCNPRKDIEPFFKYQKLNETKSAEDGDQRNSDDFDRLGGLSEENHEDIKAVKNNERQEKNEKILSNVDISNTKKHESEYEYSVIERDTSEKNVTRNKDRDFQESRGFDLYKLYEDTSLIGTNKDSSMSTELTQRTEEGQVQDKDDCDLYVNEAHNVSFTQQFIYLEQKRRSLEENTWSNKRKVQETTDLVPEKTGYVVKADLRNEDGIEKVVFPKLYNLAPLVQESDILQKILAIGVDLSKIEKAGLATKVIHMEFERDLLPYIKLFHDVGIPAENHGQVINKYPNIFKIDLRHLEVRINYLKSKKIKDELIALAIQRKPNILSLSAKVLDTRLGQYQKLFHLTGKEIRENLHKLCNLLPQPQEHIVNTKFYMQKELQFTDEEIKKIALLDPKVILLSHAKIFHAFTYCTDVMGISRELIFNNPVLFRVSGNRLKFRHQFLLRCGAAQYDPTKENYVALHPFAIVPDNIFAVDIAKSSLSEYTKFLKTI